MRAFYQAFAVDAYLDELPTQFGQIVVLCMWPVMNLILINLLIARMSEAYTRIQVPPAPPRRAETRVRW